VQRAARNFRYPKPASQLCAGAHAPTDRGLIAHLCRSVAEPAHPRPTNLPLGGTMRETPVNLRDPPALPTSPTSAHTAARSSHVRSRRSIGTDLARSAKNSTFCNTAQKQQNTTNQCEQPTTIPVFQSAPSSRKRLAGPGITVPTFQASLERAPERGRESTTNWASTDSEPIVVHWRGSLRRVQLILGLLRSGHKSACGTSSAPASRWIGQPWVSLSPANLQYWNPRRSGWQSDGTSRPCFGSPARADNLEG
jgi:hypothetical protein